MKNLLTQLYKGILLFFLLVSFSEINAQSKIRNTSFVTSDFLLSVQNLIQTGPKVLEFDVYMLNTKGGAQTFELATMQLGFLINESIHAGGTLTLSLSNTGSGLDPTIQFRMASVPMIVSPLNIYPTKTLIQQPGRVPQGSGFGSIISDVAPGTKLVHYILTNSVDFIPNTVPDLTFISTSEPSLELYRTSVSEYINGWNTNLMVTSGVDAIVNGNPVLNPTISAFSVTGGGAYCQNTGGLPVNLSGSEVGVTYTLYNGTTQLSPTIAGTGNALSFGNQLAGTYTVKGTVAGSYGNMDMTGSVVILENPAVNPGVSIAVTQNPVNSGIQVGFTATPTDGGTNPIYQWYIGTTLAGTNSNTFVYTPTNGDVITVDMISNATCASGNPVTSNKITMSVSLGTDIEQNKITFDIYSKDKNIIVKSSEKVKQINIYNSLGSMILIEKNVTGLDHFNMNNYPTGYYFVKIVTYNNVYSQKILLR